MKFILLPLFALLFLVACSEEKVHEKSAKPVSTTVLSTTKNYVSRTISGLVQPSDTTELSFEVPGKLEDVYLELGEKITKGQHLAKLEQINYRLAVEERKGQLSEAKSRLLEAERDFKRKRDLVKDGAVSRSQFDIAKSLFETAKDQVNISEARLAMAQEDLSDTILVAPYDGTISARYIEPSQLITPNAAAFLVQGKGGLEISLLVPEGMIKSLSVGQNATAHIPALSQNFDARIVEIGTAAESANAFPVVLKIIGDDMVSLKSGMSAEVTFKLDKGQTFQGSFTVDVSAVMADEADGHFLYKVVSAQEAEVNTYILKKMPVQAVEFFDQSVIVEGDLRSGERIVDAGLAFLQDGQNVVPIDSDIKRYNP